LEFCAGIQNNAHQRGDVLTVKDTVKHIGIALFNGFALPETASIVEAFQSANGLADRSQRGITRYDVWLLSAAGGRIASSSSVFVWTDSVEARGYAHNFDALLIAGGPGAYNTSRDNRLLTWLRRAYLHSDLVLPIAEGQFLLEAAGISLTTSTGCAKDRTARTNFHLCPNTATLSDASGPLQTTLSFIREDLGTEIARKITEFVVPPASMQFTSILRRNAPTSVSERIRTAARWLETNSDLPIVIDAVAHRVAMSERNFLRRFKEEIGLTPSDYLLYVRLDMSCRLLVETTLQVDQVARRCGLGSGGQLAKLFRRHLALTPTEYRSSQRTARVL
jgi:transcriptional regulator GlxA family with amidase domain